MGLKRLRVATISKKLLSFEKTKYSCCKLCKNGLIARFLLKNYGFIDFICAIIILPVNIKNGARNKKLLTYANKYNHIIKINVKFLVPPLNKR